MRSLSTGSYVVSPLFHDRSSCFEEVASGICAFDASHGVCQCCLGYLARHSGVSTPVTEG